MYRYLQFVAVKEFVGPIYELHCEILSGHKSFVSVSLLCKRSVEEVRSIDLSHLKCESKFVDH